MAYAMAFGDHDRAGGQTGDDIDRDPIGSILAHPVRDESAKPGKVVSRHLPVYPSKKFEAVSLGW